MLDIGIRGDVFILKNVNLKEALKIKDEFESTPNRKYRPYLLYKTLTGYYAGWDCINNNSIYCGTRSEPASITQIEEYAKTLG